VLELLEFVLAANLGGGGRCALGKPACDGCDLCLFDSGTLADLQPGLCLLDAGERLIGLRLQAVSLFVLSSSLLLKSRGELSRRLVLLMRRHLLGQRFS